MSIPNFFKRKTLLSGKQRPDDEPAAAELPSDPSEVFTRPTMVPNLSADAHAKEAMRSISETDAAVTAPAPRRAEEGPHNDLESIQAVVEPYDWASISQPREALDGMASHAIPPPNRTTQAALWQDGGATGRTLSDLAIDSAATLDFVDAHPRSTNRPGFFEQFDPDPGNTRTPSFEAARLAVPVSVSDLYAVGDFSGALELAEKILETQPDDPSALRYAEDCRRVLLKMCEARIGPFTHRPTVVMGVEQIRWLALDHREGFLLSLIDGSSTIDDLLDISGMPRLDALRIFAALIDKGVVKMR
jgi:hypothetical protein